MVKKRVVIVTSTVILILVAIYYIFKDDNRAIWIEGSVDSNLSNLFFYSTYISSSDSFLCSSYSMFVGRERNIKIFKYKPKRDDNLYSINIPIDAISFSPICNYKLKKISISINLGGDVGKTGFALFEEEHPNIYNPTFHYNPIGESINIECIGKRKYAYVCREAPFVNRVFVSKGLSEVNLTKKYKVNIKLITTNDILKQKKDVKQEKFEDIKIAKDSLTMRKKLKLLQRLTIGKYIKRYKRVPTKNESKELLNLRKYSSYLTDNDIAKLKKYIKFKDGYPLDDWEEPVRYKIVNGKYATLYSLGPDGEISSDDIYSGLHMGIPDPLYNNGKVDKKAMQTLRGLNALSQIFANYQYRYKRKVDKSSAKELLKEKSSIKGVLTHVDKSSIQYAKGVAVDAWGRAFIFKKNRDKDTLYSLGKDGVKSGDDIKRDIIRLFP